MPGDISSSQGGPNPDSLNYGPMGGDNPTLMAPGAKGVTGAPVGTKTNADTYTDGAHATKGKGQSTDVMEKKEALMEVGSLGVAIGILLGGGSAGMLKQYSQEMLNRTNPSDPHIPMLKTFIEVSQTIEASGADSSISDMTQHVYADRSQGVVSKQDATANTAQYVTAEQKGDLNELGASRTTQIVGQEQAKQTPGYLAQNQKDLKEEGESEDGFLNAGEQTRTNKTVTTDADGNVIQAGGAAAQAAGGSHHGAQGTSKGGQSQSVEGVEGKRGTKRSAGEASLDDTTAAGKAAKGSLSVEDRQGLQDQLHNELHIMVNAWMSGNIIVNLTKIAFIMAALQAENEKAEIYIEKTSKQAILDMTKSICSAILAKGEAQSQQAMFDAFASGLALGMSVVSMGGMMKSMRGMNNAYSKVPSTEAEIAKGAGPTKWAENPDPEMHLANQKANMKFDMWKGFGQAGASIQGVVSGLTNASTHIVTSQDDAQVQQETTMKDIIQKQMFEKSLQAWQQASQEIASVWQQLGQMIDKLLEAQAQLMVVK